MPQPKLDMLGENTLAEMGDDPEVLRDEIRRLVHLVDDFYTRDQSGLRELGELRRMKIDIAKLVKHG